MNTSEMIEVMQAYERGDPIEYRVIGYDTWRTCSSPEWDWANLHYRIAKKPLTIYLAVYEDGTYSSTYFSSKDCAKAWGCGKYVTLQEVTNV